MKKDITIFLEHILESIRLIEEYIKGKNKSDFLKSKELQDSATSVFWNRFKSYMASHKSGFTKVKKTNHRY